MRVQADEDAVVEAVDEAVAVYHIGEFGLEEFGLPEGFALQRTVGRGTYLVELGTGAVAGGGQNLVTGQDEGVGDALYSAVFPCPSPEHRAVFRVVGHDGVFVFIEYQDLFASGNRG